MKVHFGNQVILVSLGYGNLQTIKNAKITVRPRINQLQEKRQQAGAIKSARQNIAKMAAAPVVGMPSKKLGGQIESVLALYLAKRIPPKQM